MFVSKQGVYGQPEGLDRSEVGLYRSDISTGPGSQASVFAPFFWPDKAGGSRSSGRMGGLAWLHPTLSSVAATTFLDLDQKLNFSYNMHPC